MLHLLFSTGQRRLCLPVALIARVLPPAQLKPAPQAPDYIQGLLHYNEQWIPILDLCQLVYQRPSRNALNTRLVIAHLQQAPSSYLGFIAESVDETLEMNAANFSDSGLHVAEEAFFGDISTHQDDIIYQLKPQQLLSDEAWALLCGNASR